MLHRKIPSPSSIFTGFPNQIRDRKLVACQRILPLSVNDGCRITSSIFHLSRTSPNLDRITYSASQCVLSPKSLNIQSRLPLINSQLSWKNNRGWRHLAYFETTKVSLVSLSNWKGMGPTERCLFLFFVSSFLFFWRKTKLACTCCGVKS